MAVAPNLPTLPKDVKTCLEKHHVKLPAGDWTSQVVADIIAKYQNREQELESCLSINGKFYQDLRNGLARKGKKSWFG